jgi:uncharacterized protein YukE
MANLPLLPPFLPITDPNGAASASFQAFWQQFAAQITTNIEAVTNAENTATGAQAAADAAQATADSKIDQATADGLYVHRDGTATWATPTGTFDRTTFATYSAPVISNPPTQAEVQGVANAVQNMSRHLAALISDLRAIHALK